MLRFGGPVKYETSAAIDPMDMVNACIKKGYKASYAPDVSLEDTAAVKRARKAFEDNDIMIAEVGYWENLIDTDIDTREKHRKKMVECLALADELGARCAVDIFGSYVHGKGDEAYVKKNFSDEAFEEAVSMARYFIDTVKPKTAYFTYEIFAFNIVDSPESIYKLIKAVDRKQFGVHLDLANMVNSPRAYWNSGNIIRECTKLFGDKIVAAHAKDIKMTEPAITVKFEEVIAGQGNLDIASFMQEIHNLPQEIPFMMEHLSSFEEYDTAREHFKKIGLEQGIEI